MTNATKIGFLALTIVYWLFCSYIYKCVLRPVHCGCGSSIAAIDGDRGPLVFEWSEGTGLTNDKFPAYKSDLIAKAKEGDFLEITGYYFENEENTSNYENMGIARANSAKELLMPEVNADLILVKAQMMGEKEGVRDNYFEGVDFKWRNGIPLASMWTKEGVNARSGFKSMKAGILKEKSADNVLEITGYYFENEDNTSSFPNMGLARANAAKMLFSNDLSADRIRLKARMIPEKGEVRNSEFLAAGFNWSSAAGKSAAVETLEDRVVIRFPYNSVNKDFDPAVDEYLAKLATQLKNNKTQKVSITGHTDNVGGEDANWTLAMRRAKVVRDVLVKKGVSRSQIITLSEGENQPVASNDTEAGRHDNRRAEIRVN